MAYINEIVKFVESKSEQNKKALNILQNEEDILLLKAYVKKIKLDDNVRVKELNRILSVQDLLVMWLRFRAKFTITDISEIISQTEDKTRNIIGNALLNITQVDLTAQSDKCFFTSAKMSFYLSTDGDIIKDLSVSDQIKKHIKSCKYCSKNLNSFKESIKKISELALLEPENTEYVLYNKKKKGIFSKLLIIILVILVLSGLFISPDIKLPKDILNPIKSQFDDILNNINGSQKQIIKTVKKQYKKQKIKPKINKPKEKKIESKEKIEEKTKNTENSKKIKTEAITTPTKLKETSPAIKKEKKKLIKFVLLKRQRYISNKIIKILKKYATKHVGTIQWGSNLNNGKYYHLLIKNTYMKDLRKDLLKLANFKILESENKNNKYNVPKNYRRAVIWISNR